MALSSANSRSIQLSYRSINGLRGGIRTPDPKFRKLVFYPTELPGDFLWRSLGESNPSFEDENHVS